MKLSFVHRVAYAYAYLFATPRLEKFHNTLLKFALKGLGVLNYYDTKISGEDYFVSAVLPQLIERSQPVFFDVGANTGAYALMFSRQFPSASIYCFEPHPINFRMLQKSVDGVATPINLALGMEHGQFELFDELDADGSQNASMYSEVISSIHQKRWVSHAVNVDTLDAVASELGVDFIDFLKIDTEGNELAILTGAQNYLAQDRVGAILFEFNEMNAVSKSFLREFRALLGRFSLFRLLPRGLLPIPTPPMYSELFVYQNIVAIPTARLDALKRQIGLR